MIKFGEKKTADLASGNGTRPSGEASGSLVDGTRLLKENDFKARLVNFLTRWEFILFLLIILESVFFHILTPYYLDAFNLMNTTFNFCEKAIMALPMIFVILCGDIDISVAAIISLSSFCMGFAASLGAGPAALVLVGVSVGTLAGLFNGVLIAGLGMPAIAVTLASQSLFRGISHAVLGDQAYTKYPQGFGVLGQGYLGNTIVPLQLIFFLVLAVIMGLILHKTTYGRKLYAIGNSASAARFSGIRVNRIRLINFVLNGLFAGIAAVLLTSRIGSTRPNIASGFELDAITLVVLGGVSITGGKGNIVGVFLAVFLLGYLKFGMGLLNLSAKVMVIITGILLIVAVLIPSFMDTVKAKRKLRQSRTAPVRTAGQG